MVCICRSVLGKSRVPNAEPCSTPYVNINRKYFLESVTFQFHARMRSSEVAQSLKSYGHFSDHGVEK